VKTFYDGTAVKKWIIPIRPEFHQKLFTDVGQAGSHSGREGFYTYNHIPVEVAR
jgi:hypothetical protein